MEGEEGGKVGGDIRERGRNLWPSKPVDEEWRRNTYFIHIHSRFTATAQAVYKRGRGEGRREGRRAKLVKLFIGERWPIHVALARMRGMSSSMESKPRLLNIAMPSLSRRYIDFQTDHPRGYRDFLSVIYFAIITKPHRARYRWLLNVPRP